MKKRIISLLLVVIIILSLYYIKENYYEDTGKIADYGQLRVHYIDVGQGDSCFLELPNGENMLIDGGEAKHAQDVLNYISSLGYSKVNYLVATHGDSDHIGGLYRVFEEFEVENCYTSIVPSETKTYQRFYEAVENEGIQMQTPFAKDFIIDSQNFDIEVLGPLENKRYSDTNDASVVLLVSFYEFDFLFTGDAPYGVLKKYNIGDIEVLKASHHGSRTGISRALANELSPEYSIISAGKNNKYNHPHPETMKFLKNSIIYETSECGTITAVCDGNSINFETQSDVA